MEFLSAVDQFTQTHVWFSIAVVSLAILWVCVKKYVFKHTYLENYPVPVTAVDIAVIPWAVLCLGGLLYFGLQLTPFPTIISEVKFVIHLLSILLIAWYIARFVEIYIVSRLTRDDVDNYLPGIQRGLLFGIALFIGLTLFLNIMEYSITGLYVSTGAAAALVAIALQRTLGDLFSGIALSMERPFRMGDWIELEDGSQGQVIDINWRATRFRAWDRTTLILPNSELARQKIKNLHGHDHVYAPWYEVKIAGEADPRLVKVLLLEAALRCNTILKSPLPTVRLADASSVPYSYMVWVHIKNYPYMFAVREELFREIHYGLKEAGLKVASDIHEIHTRKAKLIDLAPPDTLLALKTLDLAKLLTEDELRQMASMSQRHSFDADTVLLQEGDVASAFDIIITGVVELSIKTKQGTFKSVDRLKAGQYFGMTSMVTDNPSFLQFKTMTDVTLERVDLKCFRSIIEQRPELSEGLAEIVKQRLESAQQVKTIADKPIAKFTLQDILKRMETILR